MREEDILEYGINGILTERCRQKCEVKVDGAAYFLNGGK